MTCPNSCCQNGVLTTGNPCPTCRGAGTVDAPANLTQLKKFLKPGMMLRRTHTKFCPEGETIPVVRVQGNAFTVRIVSGRNAGQESWHYYGKAPQYACDDRGFTVTLGDDYGIARYEYVSVGG